MADFCLRKCNGVRKTMSRNHKNSSKNRSQNTKIHQHEQQLPPSRKNSPQDRKWSGKGARSSELNDPPERLKSAKVGKKRLSKINVFSTPSWNRLFLILGSPRHPKISPNELKIDPGTAKAHFWRECIFYRPCYENTCVLTPRKHPK